MTNKLTARVTGASSGMGKSIVKRPIADGSLVYVAASIVEKMADLAPLGAIPLRRDITKEAEVAVATITARPGGVDVLVTSAGQGPCGPVEVNVLGPAQLTRLLLPAMRAMGRGTIVNITSMGGNIHTLLGARYHATKHALQGWSDSLRPRASASW